MKKSRQAVDVFVSSSSDTFQKLKCPRAVPMSEYVPHTVHDNISAKEYCKNFDKIENICCHERADDERSVWLRDYAGNNEGGIG